MRTWDVEDEINMLRAENKELTARIAELEAAAQWHPASEPPDVPAAMDGKQQQEQERK